jgi:hypothetical protein
MAFRTIQLCGIGKRRKCMNKETGRVTEVIIAGIVAIGLIILGCVPDPEEIKSDPHIADIRLTEIQYHPDNYDGIGNDSLEFIELKNIGSETINLGALECSAGMTYDFPGDAEISAGGFYVIASNKNCFTRRYGFNPDGVYSGQLSNNGETIEITDLASDEIIISQTYGDNSAWPGEADGAGYSLVPINPSPGKNMTNASDWRGSSAIGGSPGKDDENKALDSALLNLRITEIMYHPDFTDSLGRDSMEFIELKNVGSEVCTLTGVTFASGIEYTFPADSTLKPGAFCVLASNSKWFKSRYGFKPYDEYEGQLRNSGETINLKEIKSGQTLVSLEYLNRSPWMESYYADSWGFSLVTKSQNPSRAEQANPDAWRHSLRLNGSPGRDDPEPIYVNEVLMHTDAPLTDAVELYNPQEIPVDIGNWFISNELDHPTKFRIPAGTTISAHGYVVFDEHDFNGDPASSNSFHFSEYGDSVFLFADSIWNKQGCYYHGFAFGPIDTAASFGRYITSTGEVDFVEQAAPSLGAENKGPRVGPVVITEIMYDPADDVSEFIEIKNISTSDVPLYNKTDTTRTWKIPAVGFSFPANITLKAGEIACIVTDGAPLDSIKSRYSIPDSVQLFTTGATLDNSLDSVIIAKPYIDSASLTLPNLPYITVDRVVYTNTGAWPKDAGGTGKSLQRIDFADYANDPVNWKAADQSAGR